MLIVEPYMPDDGLLLDLISALKSESEMDLERRTTMNEEQIQMDNKIWSKLPEELLMLVLSSLPTLMSRNLRVVCKRWQDFLSPAPIFRQISSTLVPSSSPAFVIGGSYDLFSPHPSYLLHSHPLGVYPLSLDFMGPEPLYVLTSCKSIVCCRSRYMQGAPTSYYICNPLTRKWITLPPRLSHVRMVPEFGFYGLAFDSTTRTCIFVIGINNRSDGENNNMEMEMYDSYTNEWTLIKMGNLSNAIFPSSQGIYSKGSFYWINDSFHQYSDVFPFHLVAFNVAERSWGVIKLPGLPDASDDRSYWNLTGYDGNVLVACKNDLSLWKLNEERQSCSELQLFPRSLAEENARSLNGHCDRNLIETKVVANSCGWVLVYMCGYKMVVFDAQGKMVVCIQGNLLKAFDHLGLPLHLYGYEINNVWWP